MPSIDPYLKLALERQARQFVLTPDEKPYLVLEEGRVSLGKIVTAQQINKGVGEIVPPSYKAAFAQSKPLSWSYAIDGMRFIIETRPSTAGVSVVFTNNSPGMAMATAKQPAVPEPEMPEITPGLPEVPDYQPTSDESLELSPEAPAEVDPSFESYAKRFAAVDDGAQINRFLMKMMEMNASDLHMCSGCKPMFRIDGELKTDRMGEELETQNLVDMLFEIAQEDSFDDFQETGSCDFAYELGALARFRVNIFKEYRGISGAFRRIPQEIPTAEKLGLPKVVRMLSGLPKGLVLVTGPTGCGKSTTLAAMLDLCNRTRTDHIITVEQPIEFVHPNKKCLVHQREIGLHTTGFGDALRDALREDPDIVLVGEMRDLETISMAIETAATGHLVFATLHTTTAINTVDRIIEMFPADRQDQVRTMLADSLRAVISQNLLKKNGGGRVAAQEILIITPSVSNLIRERKSHQLLNVMQTGRSLGMQLLTDELVRLVKAKTVEPMEAYRKSVDKLEFVRALEQAGVHFKAPQDIEVDFDEKN